jgi:hypothetical protein
MSAVSQATPAKSRILFLPSKQTTFAQYAPSVPQANAPMIAEGRKNAARPSIKAMSLILPLLTSYSGHRGEFRNTDMNHGIGPHFATRKSML